MRPSPVDTMTAVTRVASTAAARVDLQPAARHLPPYVRALWDVAPHFARLTPPPSQDVAESVLVDATRRQRPVLVTHSAVVPTPTLYLPLHWQQALLLRAAVAHACAHLAYGDGPQARGKLKPIQLALVGVLEDARVEAQAMAELPGLRSLWLPWHRADANSGNTFEALLQRLQRSLLDPCYQDPHPWIRKACSLYQAAPATPEGLRQVASVLGNDVGQMRMPFNAQLYVVEPSYRDDNTHLWLPDPQAPPSSTPLSAPSNPQEGQAQQDSSTPAPQPVDQQAEPSAARPTAEYGEWDRLIGRMRPKWCQVFEEDAPQGTPKEQLELSLALSRQAALLARLKRVLQQGLPLNRAHVVAGRAAEGERFHLNALVHAATDQRLRRQPDPHVYLQALRAPQPMHVLVLLDASVSTLRCAALSASQQARVTLLEVLRASALLTASALEHAGHACAVQAFASNTRHQVRVQRIKNFDDRADSTITLARLAGVRSEWSTRIGAALRHACAQLRDQPRPHVLLLTDGQPHDTDVHDSRYLPADLQRAVQEARRCGVAVSCLNVLGSEGTASMEEHRAMQRALGVQSCRAVQTPEDLPHQLLACLAC
jgi:nitric oxide reductase activation protein